MHSSIEYKIQKYRNKLEDEPRNIMYLQKLNVYENMIGGGCDVSKDGTYVFYVARNDNIINEFILSPSSAFNKISSYLPGFRVKVGGNELKFNECTKPDTQFTIVPPSQFTRLPKAIIGIQYTSVGSTSAEAKKDIETYEAKKQNDLDAAIIEINTMKKELSDYKNKRLAELAAYDTNVSNIAYFKDAAIKQKSFNMALKPFFSSHFGSSDSKKIEPLNATDINSCKLKMDNIKNALNAAVPSLYSTIQQIVDSFNMVIVVQAVSTIKVGSSNKILAIYDIGTNQQLYPNIQSIS
jgi:hypothetical protein